MNIRSLEQQRASIERRIGNIERTPASLFPERLRPIALRYAQADLAVVTHEIDRWAAFNTHEAEIRAQSARHIDEPKPIKRVLYR